MKLSDKIEVPMDILVTRDDVVAMIADKTKERIGSFCDTVDNKYWLG